ncbi:MAG: enoyl-CoA hydratase/isomerase family protein [Acidimicrobiales bacterium]
MTTTFSEITVQAEGPVATVTLNRPEALNAITPTMLAELNRALDELAGRSELSVIVLTGAGRAFSAGVDLKALGERTLTQGKVGDILDVPARAVTAKLSGIDKVVVAKVNGHCFTGALELALACDLMVVATEATIGDTHAKFGLRPTWAMSARLPRAVGPQAARLLSYTARSIKGDEAHRLGMAAVCAPRAELDGVVEALVSEIAANSPASLAAYKDLYRQGAGLGLDGAIAYEYGTDYDITDTEERLAPWR